ncbi:hypothetical protein N7539_009268 [Penicillium diatomitis]|uniref:Inheritance of peroxisomes protein 1 n=1 Tax=Penicillium diatomitis TaxID=2819901 RepID=A0A9W9WLD2_9EURO|nr:uncharacterized protein N7539_009268 [Penicillium diatomitis]KAJ5469650.1 hypothetical protein N7539_009268 [Penicillium diatomitis]
MPEPQSNTSGPVHSIRRAVTLPTKLNPHAQRSKGNLSENVIFYHPFAKIVHFAPRALVPIPSSSAPSDFDYPVDTIETLPWRSATERTVATAPLILERGLTVFLKCGNVVRAILRNSQCWCVDGVSKFVLRIRPLTYYRIELPYETTEDKASVEELKAALPNVLRYEVTPCPFKRAFSVELPEEAVAPRRKRAWKPKENKDTLSVPTPTFRRPSVDIKLDWPDSASTSDDTDGAATDDSGLISERAYSTTSKTRVESRVTSMEDDSAGSRLDTDFFNAHVKSTAEKRETFTSLREKFDATPRPEVLSIQNGIGAAIDAMSLTDTSSPVVRGSVEGELPSSCDLSAPDASQPEVLRDITQDAVDTKSREQQAHCPSIAIISQEQDQRVESILIADSTSAVSSDEHCTTQSQLLVRPEDDRLLQTSGASPEPTAQKVTTSGQALNGSVGSPNGPGCGLEDSVLTGSKSPPHHGTGDVSRQDSSSVIEDPMRADHDAFQTLNTAALMNENNLQESNSASQIEVGRATSQPMESPQIDTTLNMPGSITLDDSLHSPASYTPSAATMHDKGTLTLTPDMGHMSTEFRRRAQATRQRDVSPMPAQSALYQPPNEQASSLLTKALSLVLVPPIHLFIILMHVAARIVISPALGSTIEDTPSGSQALPRESFIDDDYSFPLERESSSEYEDAQIMRKLDPWDLD